MKNFLLILLTLITLTATSQDTLLVEKPVDPILSKLNTFHNKITTLNLDISTLSLDIDIPERYGSGMKELDSIVKKLEDLGIEASHGDYMDVS